MSSDSAQKEKTELEDKDEKKRKESSSSANENEEESSESLPNNGSPNVFLNDEQSIDNVEVPKKKHKGYWRGTFLPLLRQQQLPGWQPLASNISVLIFISVCAVVLIALGIVVLVTSLNLPEYKHKYTKCSHLGQECELTFTIDKDLSSPVYLQYELRGFYQNHKRFLTSRNYDQLSGNDMNNYDKLSSCEPAISFNDEHKSSSIYYPCGLVALSHFTDSFEVYKYGNTSPLKFATNDLALNIDRDHMFKRPKVQPKGIVVIPDVTDENFMVWMRPAALSTFRKLVGVYRGATLEKGTRLLVKIQNNFDVETIDGTKSIVLTQAFWLGHNCFGVGILFLVIGVVSLFLTIALFILSFRKRAHVG